MDDILNPQIDLPEPVETEGVEDLKVPLETDQPPVDQPKTENP